VKHITLNAGAGEPLDTLGKLFMTILSSNDVAEKNGMHTPPIYEVLYPAGSLGGMLRFTKLYNESAAIATKEFRKECNPKTVSLMPVHVFSDKGNWYATLHDYFRHYSNSFRLKVDSFRPVIPRADIADRKGFVASVLATKRALSSYGTFSAITGVKAEPVVDAGPLMFRGGLAPSRVREFIKTYPGARTVTIRPSFRFDNDVEDAKSAISTLNRVLPDNKAEPFTKEELKTARQIEDIFARNYSCSVIKLNSLEVFPEELRVLDKSMHSSLRRSFALYSLGIPPEMIGTGRAIVDCIQQGLVKDLEHFYPNIKTDLVKAGALLNRENLGFLCKLQAEWQNIQKDVKLVEDYTDSVLGPDSTDAFLHRNHTSNVFHLWSAGKDFSKDIMAAAKARRCMG
ncbi:phosphoenolpyruvate carboxylase, partial [Candidatus Woesearchaeota archaeon]|nr:phosphoenolpyruvate carboxylase [Candidatus Woesearchaeota archaeon]